VRGGGEEKRRGVTDKGNKGEWKNGIGMRYGRRGRGKE
jgi:hypothetical protein